MAKIKIISNPYQKVTVFQSWDDATAQWVEIDRDQNADSQLLREELCVGFFPFKAKQIVDVIIHEYSAGSEKVEIVFEGTDDEYLELDSICSQDDYPDRINLLLRAYRTRQRLSVSWRSSLTHRTMLFRSVLSVIIAPVSPHLSMLLLDTNCCRAAMNLRPLKSTRFHSRSIRTEQRSSLSMDTRVSASASAQIPISS